MSVSLLQKQHEQIREMIRELKHLTKENLEEKAFFISLKIGQLAGVLAIHLQGEDKFLYPRLLQHENQQVRQIAAAFIKEMGDLGQKFTSFKTTFKQPQNIKAQPEKFKQDLKTLVALLNKRMEREEKELYPLLGK